VAGQVLTCGCSPQADARVNARIRDLVSAPNARFVGKAPGDITRDIVQAVPPVRKNVVLVTIESLSASYMGQFGDGRALTPNLDALADQSLFFTRMLAAGTRTRRLVIAAEESFLECRAGRKIASLRLRKWNRSVSSVGLA
jgi:hypothetical protein